ncbi:MAG: hypothetical protein JWR21_1248, partial [Herminiimonas sp.]|nr:hypothetical protein [Herminiimonas sp.]
MVAVENCGKSRRQDGIAQRQK